MLTVHPDVTQATVIARQDQLQATGCHIAPASGNGCPPDSLHKYLRQRLPNYLIPTAVVMLDALPVRPNGKLDHAALPAPMADSDQRGRAPRTPQEKLLCELLARALGLLEVSIGDNFSS